jgi:hypothetical protein
MPLESRDAIDITRRLGKRYLWVDSQCVVQNSLEDWENKTSRVGEIYEISFYTHTASGFSNNQC